MPARNYSSTAEAKTLSGAIVAGATSMTLNSITTLPGTPNVRPYTLVIDPDLPTEEIVSVTANPSGSVLTIVRGQDGTSDQGHANGAVVKHMITARDLKEPQDHIYANAGVHGVTGAVVGTSDAQILTNKTINSSGNTMTVAQSAVTSLVSDLAAKAPIANPTFTGTVGGVTKAMVGLGNVDNTADSAKPISTATQAALDGKSGTGHGHDYAASGHGHAYLSTSGGTVSGSLTVTGNTESNFYYSNVGFQSTGGTIETLGSGPIQTNGVEITGTIVRPRTGGTGSVGSSGQRFIKIYTTQAADVSSDRRLKSEITDSALGLDFINDLRPVSYKLLSDEENRVHYGLIAQEVKEAVDNSGVSDFGGWSENPESTQSLAYDEFTAPLIKAIQQLSIEVETLKAKVAELEAN